MLSCTLLFFSTCQYRFWQLSSDKKNNKELFPPNASVQFTAHIQYIRLGHFCGSKELTLEAMLKKSPGLKMPYLLFYVCQNTIDVY